LSCGGKDKGTDPAPITSPAAILIEAGQDQAGVVGQELAAPLVVRVIDADSQPVQGQVVNFVVVAGSGSVFAGTASTNMSGIAQEIWTLGPLAVDSQVVEARAVDPNDGSKMVLARFRARTAPRAPTIGVVTRGNASASVGFTAAAHGGSPIVGFTAYCTPSGGAAVTGNNTASPVLVAGLTNGTQYACSVVATNAVGNSAASASANVTPATVPDAPAIGTAAPGNGSASIAFTAPANGGSAITGYAASCAASGQATRTGTGSASPITVASLTNGTQYDCSVTATNSLGTSLPSATVNVTPVGPPGAPGSVSWTPDSAAATVAFSPPASTGGATITSYTASCALGANPAVTQNGSASPITVTGLNNGSVYACNVKATNAAGTGTASTNVSVTPRSKPGAPTNLAGSGTNGGATLTFTAPGNGGSAITKYTATCYIVPQTPVTKDSSATTIRLTGLTNESAYTCSVTATNAAGTGPASSAVNVTPTASAGPFNTGTLLCPYSHSVANAFLGLTATVSYTCTATQRTMTGNQVPDHTPGIFPNAGNPHAIAAQSGPPFKTTLTPAIVAVTNVSIGTVGYAKNGLKFDPATAEVCPGKSYCPSGMTGTWNVEALGQTLFSAGVDNSNAHVQPNGAYHYHGMPTGYMNYLGNNDGSRMIFVGLALDGFPVYAKWGYAVATDTLSGIREIVSSYRKKATLPAGRIDTLTVAYGTFTQDWEYVAGLGDLDECNGRFGKTPEFPSGIYHYFITNGYPYIQRCYKGTATP